MLRVGVYSKGVYLRMGYAFISGENKWCIQTALKTFQQNARELHGTKMDNWVLDAGTGMVSAMKSMTQQQGDSDNENDSEDGDADEE